MSTMKARRDQPVTAAAATGPAVSDEERAHARERFRRRLEEAQRRATPEKRAKLRAALGFDAPVA
jgi:hypothetical protein